MLGGTLNDLTRLRERLNIPERFESFDQPISSYVDIERKLKTGGVEINFEEIRRVGPYLTYEEKYLVMLYLKEAKCTVEELRNNSAYTKSYTPKFHLTWCRKVEEMYNSKQIGRYVVTQSESNMFTVEAMDDNREHYEVKNIRLYPCQFCLEEIRYKGFDYHNMSRDERLSIVESFSINNFVDENKGKLRTLASKFKQKAIESSD